MPRKTRKVRKERRTRTRIFRGGNGNGNSTLFFNSKLFEKDFKPKLMNSMVVSDEFINKDAMFSKIEEHIKSLIKDEDVLEILNINNSNSNSNSNRNSNNSNSSNRNSNSKSNSNNVTGKLQQLRDFFSDNLYELPVKDIADILSMNAFELIVEKRDLDDDHFRYIYPEYVKVMSD